MKYFIVNLLIHLLIFSSFVALMLVFLKRNRKRKTRHGVSFLIPVFFSALAVVYMVFFTGPRILDIPNVVSSNYMMVTGVFESSSNMGNTIRVDGIDYCINPMAKLPSEGSLVRLKYTTYSRYIMEMQAGSAVSAE
jgi:hypothetical protein